MDTNQMTELLLQAYEHEKGGVLVYETALKCVINPELKQEWSEYLEQTRNHVRVLSEVLTAFEIDPYQETPGRLVVRYLGASLVQAMQMALTSAPREAAQLVACECVTNAEMKDHLDWELLGKCAAQLDGQRKETLRQAVDTIEEQEDEHFYHSKGWCRELWLEALGLPAVLPPPEEREHVTTGVAAAQAQQRSMESRER